MRRIKASWLSALLLMSTVAVNATLDLHNINTNTRVRGKRIENLISGVDRNPEDTTKASGFDSENIAARRAPDAGLDVHPLADSVADSEDDGSKAKGQSKGHDGTAGVDGQSQGVYRNQSTPAEQGQGDAKTSSGDALILEENAHMLPTAVVELPGKQHEPEEASIPETTLPEVLRSTREKPTPPIAPEPHPDIAAEKQNSTAAIENSKPTAKAESTAPSVEGLDATASSPEPAKAVEATPIIPASESISAAMNHTSVAAVTVEAGKGPYPEAKGGGIASSTNATDSSSAAVAAEHTSSSTTTMAAAIIVEAGPALNVSFALDLSPTSMNGTALPAAPTSTTTSTTTYTTAVTVVAGVDPAPSHAPMAPAFTFPSAPDSTNTSTTSHAALNTTSTRSTAAVATPVPSPAAGLPAAIVGNVSAAEQAAANGGCHCACACPAGSFPMAAPPPPPAFQLGPMMSMSTMQTVVTPNPETSSAPNNTASSAPATPTALPPTVVTTSTSASIEIPFIPPPPATNAPFSFSPPSSNPGAASPSLPPPPALLSSSTPSPTPTNVPLQSQAAADAPPAPPQDPESPTTTPAGQQLGNNGLPFDINTIALVSRVTVNLGRRAAEATAGL
ncbi:hypothetical protein IAQ61_004377 [Plenodomus lingam]|uniref:uncharacterized protein n=1 Tax=Leptosphaeria maculans TaxID=5022 RepID=UPI003325B7B1|nr:hypothetical protein IAQ61_004377 [Plenodomus lingam]